MDNTVLIVVIGCFQALAVAIIGGLFARDSRKKKMQLDDAETRAALRVEESRLNMKLLSASLGLSVETARALKRGTTNGEMDEALDTAEAVKAEYYNFVNAVAAKQITG